MLPVESLNGLATFVTTARSATFTEAADALGISRSAVGKAIARLEARLGVRLFHRTTRSVSLTPEGEVFLPYVDQVYVAKMSPDRARDTIQQKFAAIIPSAQVQLSHTAGRQSSVDLVSGVANPDSLSSWCMARLAEVLPAGTYRRAGGEPAQKLQSHADSPVSDAPPPYPLRRNLGASPRDGKRVWPH